MKVMFILYCRILSVQWVWVNSGSWWWTGRPGVLWFMGSQGVGHDWANELNWTDYPSVPLDSEFLKSKDLCLPSMFLLIAVCPSYFIRDVNYSKKPPWHHPNPSHLRVSPVHGSGALVPFVPVLSQCLISPIICFLRAVHRQLLHACTWQKMDFKKHLLL